MKLWNLKKYKDFVAIVTEEGRMYSYKEVDSLQEQLSEQITKRALVCLLSDNDLGGIVGYLSCVINDEVAMVIPNNINIENLLEMCGKYFPDYIWVLAERWDEAYQILEKDYENCFEFLKYKLLKRKERCTEKLHKNLILLLSTSGSTGSAKLVRISKKNLSANTKSICSYLKIGSNDRAVMSLPISYTYGLSVINTFLFKGGSIVLTRAKVMQGRFWEYVRRYEVTFFSGVPYMYECMKKMRVDLLELPKLHVLTQAGGKLSKEQQCYWGEYAKQSGKEFYVMYGQTEATARISYLPSADCLKKIGSVGIAVPNSKVFIKDKNDNIITKEGEVGEIVCSGRHVSMGYAERRQELFWGDSNKGILYTGDLGYKDGNGYLYIIGRKNRFAKVYGVRIDLNRVEELARDIIKEEVIALSDEQKIYLFTDSNVNRYQLTKLSKRLSFRVNIFEIRQMCMLPRKENGKVDYSGIEY